MPSRILLVSAVCIVVCQTGLCSASKTSKWKIGEPIVWYWAGPASPAFPGVHNLLNDTTAAQLTAGGWNICWANTVDDLDTAHRQGLRALFTIGLPDLHKPDWVNDVDRKVALARSHPATYAYYVCDEPRASAFDDVAKVVAHLRKKDPIHPAIVNLYPVEASAGVDGQLGVEGDMVTAYREHVRRFVEKVKPDLLSYDYYPFMARGDALTYFLNLMMIREAALKAGIPFINVTQAIAHTELGWRWPTEHEMRWLAYTTLAYGGQGICWYIYNSRINEVSGFFKDCPESTVPKPEYWAVSRTNRDFAAIAAQLQPLKSVAAYHAGPHEKFGGSDDERWKKMGYYQCGPFPLGGTALPESSRFQVESSTGTPDVLLGCFGKSGGVTSHVLVVNLDYKKYVAMTLRGPGPMEVFHAPTRKWSPSMQGSRVKLDLEPGGGVLVRLR